MTRASRSWPVLPARARPCRDGAAPARNPRRTVPRRRPSGRRSPAGLRRCRSSWASSRATSPWPRSGWPMPRRAGCGPGGTGPDGGPGAQARWSVRRAPRATVTPPRKHGASGRAGRRAEREEDVRRRLAEQRDACVPGSRRCRRSAELHSSKASAPRSKASWPRCASVPPEPGAPGALQAELAGAERRRDHAVERAGFLSHEATRAAAEAERARHLVAEAREQEAHAPLRPPPRGGVAGADDRPPPCAGGARARPRRAGSGRRGAAGCARPLRRRRARPAERFRQHRSRGRRLAERLLGDWMHAVLVRDHDTVRAIQAWHAEHQPGSLVLLPLDPGPRSALDGHRSTTGCGPRARRSAGSAPHSPGPRCSTRPAGCCGGRAAPSFSPARPPPPARSAGGRSSVAGPGSGARDSAARRRRGRATERPPAGWPSATGAGDRGRRRRPGA